MLPFPTDGPGGRRRRGALLHRAAGGLGGALACALAAGLLSGCGWGRPEARNVLLISIDTLRADHLGSYGYSAAQTPVLDALAARGARFDQAATVAPLTLPAHTSLLTGTFPTAHGVRDNGGFYVDEDQITLAEMLAGHGYRTGAFVGAFVLDGRWGIGQGFERYFDDFDLDDAEITGMDSIQRPGHVVIDAALEWLAQPDERPFFAWVHLYDPHTPYEAPPPFRSRYPATMIGAYDAEVAATDVQVGRLLDRLDRDGRLAETLVVVVGDHGESLGEHREPSHGFFIYDAVMRIPLLMAGPGVPNRVVPDQVRIVDVLPTILDLLALPAATQAQGESLEPALRGERLDLLAFAESWYPRYHYGWSELIAIRDGRYKFILAPRRELYDVERDPGELEDLAEQNPSRADALERALRAMQQATETARAAEGPQEIDPEVEERLRALGYIGSSASARNLADSDTRGDPKDKIELYNLLKQAGSDSSEGRIDEAVEKVRRALDTDPEIVEGHVLLGNLLGKADQRDAAIDAYRRALDLDPENKSATFSLALAYKNAGRLDDATAGFERALALDPRNGKVLFQLADIWMRRGDFDRAAETLEGGLGLDVERAAFLVKLGETYIEQKRWDEAERVLTDALAEKPDVPRAHYDLGLIHEERGRLEAAVAAYEAELAHNADNFSASFNLGKLLARAGRGTEAARRFRQAVDKNPAFGEGYLYLAKALLDTNDLPGAEDAAKKGLSLEPERRIAPLGHYVLADVYSRQGREQDAARHVSLAQRMERGGS